jgi:hypothetical protein
MGFRYDEGNMTSRIALGVAVGLALALAWPGHASAQQPDFKAAAEHYKAADSLMAQGNYAGAALEYAIAYDITKDPILFFKIGTANEKAGKCNIALTYFQRYLKEGNPSDDYRRVTEEKIAGCKAAIGDTSKPPPDPVDPPPPDPDRVHPDEPAIPDEPVVGGGDGMGGGLGPSFTDKGGSWKRSAAWISTGVTIGMVAVATVLYMSAEGSEEDLQALIDFRDDGQPISYEEVQVQYDDLVAEGERFDRLSTIAFAAAGVSAAAAITFFVLDARSGSAKERPVGFVGSLGGTRVQPRIDRHGAGVVMGWEF